jgi:NIMA (never in mitosis gene a)-related kinase 1/4/5
MKKVKMGKLTEREK